MGTKCLIESREHWVENKQQADSNRLLEIDISTLSCACCLRYNSHWNPDHHDCSGCPIRAYTGEPYCRGTPYYKVESLLDEVDYRVGNNNPIMSLAKSLQDACQEELDFIDEVIVYEESKK